MTIDDIKKRLSDFFLKSRIEVIDMTSDSNHFSVLIISDIFSDLSLIDRHKLVYSALNQYIETGEIHALTIKSHTLDESK